MGRFLKNHAGFANGRASGKVAKRLLRHVERGHAGGFHPRRHSMRVAHQESRGAFVVAYALAATRRETDLPRPFSTNDVQRRATGYGARFRLPRPLPEGGPTDAQVLRLPPPRYPADDAA